MAYSQIADDRNHKSTVLGQSETQQAVGLQELKKKPRLNPTNLHQFVHLRDFNSGRFDDSIRQQTAQTIRQVQLRARIRVPQSKECRNENGHRNCGSYGLG